MKKHVSIAWVAALRSDKYQQGKDYLKSVDGTYCALGVLVELSNISCDLKCQLPQNIVECAGLRNPHGFSADLNTSIITMNNTKTFKEIADIIEKEWQRL